MKLNFREKETKIEKPKDWNDQDGWEKFFASLFPNGNFADECLWIGSISLNDIEKTAKELADSKVENIWFAGCGISLLPRALSQRGFEVFATDISRTAISFQNSKDRKIQDLINQKVRADISESGSLRAEIHDFRRRYKENYFDLIINTKAFQGFDHETMSEIAQTHFDALKPSRQAIFDTVNVQGERREMLEETLVRAGFLIPFYDLNRWYRSKLNKTDLPYVFVLGNPIIPAHGIYMDGERRESDMQVLRAITSEFREKQQAELESEREKLSHPEAKIASIIYSTG